MEKEISDINSNIKSCLVDKKDTILYSSSNCNALYLLLRTATILTQHTPHSVAKRIIANIKYPIAIKPSLRIRMMKW